MAKYCSITLRVLFEDPFYIGIFEKRDKDYVQVCKVTFGSEPKDYEIESYILRNYSNLKFSDKFKEDTEKCSKINPKRMIRKIRKEVSKDYIGTKSQNFLKLQHEKDKIEHKELSKKQKEKEKMEKYIARMQKKKEKHKGR